MFSKLWISFASRLRSDDSTFKLFVISQRNNNPIILRSYEAYDFYLFTMSTKSLLLMCSLHYRHCCSCDTPPCARLATRPADTPRCSTARDCTRDTRAGPALSCTRRTSCRLSCPSPRLLSLSRPWSGPLSLPLLSWSGDCVGGRRRAW